MVSPPYHHARVMSRSSTRRTDRPLLFNGVPAGLSPHIDARLYLVTLFKVRRPGIATSLKSRCLSSVSCALEREKQRHTTRVSYVLNERDWVEIS